MCSTGLWRLVIPGTVDITAYSLSNYDVQGATVNRSNGLRLLSSGGRVSAISSTNFLQLVRFFRFGASSSRASLFGWSFVLRRAFSYDRAINRWLCVLKVGTSASRFSASRGVDWRWPVTRRSPLFWSNESFFRFSFKTFGNQASWRIPNVCELARKRWLRDWWCSNPSRSVIQLEVGEMAVGVSL